MVVFLVGILLDCAVTSISRLPSPASLASTNRLIMQLRQLGIYVRGGVLVLVIFLSLPPPPKRSEKPKRVVQKDIVPSPFIFSP